MNSGRLPGSFLIYVGIALIVLGIIVRYTNVFHYLGRLPGDIRIEKDNFRFYFPITTMILISLIISLIIRIFRK